MGRKRKTKITTELLEKNNLIFSKLIIPKINEVDEIFNKYFTKKTFEFNELRQFVFLIVLQMANLEKYDTFPKLKYLIASICDLQIKSNTSPWHKHYRQRLKNKIEELDINLEIVDDTHEIENEKIEKEKLYKKMHQLINANYNDISLISGQYLFKKIYIDKMSYANLEAHTKIVKSQIFNQIKKFKKHIKNELIKWQKRQQK